MVEDKKRWAVWVHSPWSWGLRVAEAVTAEEAIAIVRGELNASKNRIVGMLFSTIMGAEPYEDGMKRTSELEIRQALNLPSHACETCEDWFAEEHHHKQEDVHVG